MTAHTSTARPHSMARRAAGLAAVSLVAGSALFGAAVPANAAPSPAWSGFVSSGWAAPVKLEIFEPMIPVPDSPQLELEMGYSVVKSDAASSKSRSSWLWPGDAVGDGMKTIVEQFGLPPQLGENGYPVQVNAVWPGDTTSAKDEPMPGMVMRTGAGEKQSYAEVGFSPDGDIADLPSADAKPSAAPSPTGLLGLPGLPQLPLVGQGLNLGALPGLSELAAVGNSMSKGGKNMATPGIPPQLAGIIDFSGYSSKSRTIVSDTQVRTVAQSALGDVRILGGLVRLEGVTTLQESVSDGKKASSKGQSTVGGLVVLGQRFAFTDRGFVVAGTPVAGVPVDAAKALKMLGITLTMPAITTEDEGLRASGLSEGLKIEIDAALLAKALKILPLQQIVDLVPQEAGQLKSVAGLLTGLSPRTVLTLGNAGTATETVTAMAPPAAPGGSSGDSAPSTDDPAAAPADTNSSAPATSTSDSGSSSSAGTGTGDDAGTADVVAPGAPTDEISGGATTQAASTDTIAPMGAGLPPLTTLPGFLTILALGLASAAGVYLRKAGVLALGTGASCSHGLDSGLPDLRKA